MQKKEHKLKILICELDLRILSRLESWVQTIGEESIITDDAIVALELFKEHKPDIILISQALKNMGGLELLEKIKKILPTQPTILMISSEQGEFFKRAIDLQVDRYLNKPVEAQPLFQAIESLSQEKIWHQEFILQKRRLEDYKDAIDLSFSVSRHDINGKIIYVNDLFCTTTKIRYNDVMRGVINPLQNENENMELVWDALKNDAIYRDRQVFKLEDGSEKILDVTAVALQNDKGEVSEYLVFSDDVTDIIHSARKIKNQELDNRLAKLNHARELNRVKDSFLTIFTHELKTPLNSIINFSQYVLKHLAREEFSKKERLLDQVKEINISGHFMLDMITNLMEAIKLKDTNIALNIEEISPSQTIQSIIDSSINRDNINVEVIENQASNIFSDESRFRQIIGNLLSNALKYASSKVKIEIDSTQEAFKVEIMDDGKGFNDTKQLFNIFEQSDADSLTREATGTGVGLYIVKQLCDRMSYDIELSKSDILGGARVIVKGKRDIR